MKKLKTTKKSHASQEMRAEYDFSGGIRGKHAAQYASGTNVVVLDPDVARNFPTADDVNETLRAVAKLMSRKRSRARAEIA